MFVEILRAVSVGEVSAAAILVVTVTAFCIDYRQWRRFGQGSPPGIKTWRGFLVLRLQDAYIWLSGQDDTNVLSLRSQSDKRRFLPDLPKRSGSRPTLVRWHAPQRVKRANMQDSGSSLFVHGVLADFVNEHVQVRGEGKSQIRLGTSRLEGKGSAIFIADSVGPINAEVETMFREIFHIRSQDLSFHTILAPADAAELIEKGWGERFALAGRMALTGRRRGCILPEGILLVYPLREPDDLQILKSVVQAAVDFAVAG